MANYTVTITNDDPFNGGGLAAETADGGGLSLREAIGLANATMAADTIDFAAGLSGGTIRLTQGTSLIVTSDITINGDIDADGAPEIIVSGDVMGDDNLQIDSDGNAITNVFGGNLGDNVRVFDFTSGTSVLSGLVITGGLNTATGGGGVQVAAGVMLTISDSSVSGNFANLGGGISNLGTVTVENSLVEGNRIDDNGSGLLTGGGGISNDGQLDIEGSSLSFNNSSGSDNGGGVFTTAGSYSRINNSTIDGNSVSSGGGLSTAGSLYIANSTISNNGGSIGGGIEVLIGGILFGTNLTIVGNDASNGGGISVGSGASAYVYSSTITGNDAAQYGMTSTGAGIRNAGTLTISDSIAAGNEITSGVMAYIGDLSDIATVSAGTTSYNGTNLFSQAGAGDADDFIESTLGNIFASVGANPQTGVTSGLLADNGGDIQTVALVQSLANLAIDGATGTQINEFELGIDVNGDGIVGATIDVDARGAGFDRLLGGAVDIGAFEVLSDPTDLVVTTTMDVVDPFDGLLSLREAVALANDPTAGNMGDGDADNDGNDIDRITFDEMLQGETINLTQGPLTITSDVSINGNAKGAGLADAIAGPDMALAGSNALAAGGTGEGIGGGTGGGLDGGALTNGGVGGGGYGYTVTISGDANGDDATTTSNGGYTITDVATNTNSADNTQIFQVTSGSLDLYSIIITGGRSTTSDGGAIQTDAGTSLYLGYGVEIAGNEAYGYDGGGVSVGGTAMIYGASILQNAATNGSGGGLHIASGASASTRYTYISENMATLVGGGLFNQGVAEIRSTTVQANTADNGSGGIRNNGGTLDIVNSSVTGNTAVSSGGGIGIAGGTATITNTTIAGNSTGTNGGAISFFNSATLTLNSTTISGNNAVNGGAIYDAANGTTLTIGNSIIAGNASGDGMSDDFGFDATGTPGLTFNGVNIFTQAGFGDGDDITETDLTNIFASVGANADTGVMSGVLAGGHIAILEFGAAFDAGDISALPADIFDLDFDADTTEALPRDAFGGQRIQGLGLDIGAVEIMPTPETQSLVVTISEDTVNAFDNETSLREAVQFANFNGLDDNVITFDPGLSGSVFRLPNGTLFASGQFAINGDVNGDGNPDIILSGDVNGDDALMGGTQITDVNANVNDSDNIRILNIGASNADVTLENLIITGGFSSGSPGDERGGAVRLTGGSLTISNSTVAGNKSAVDGGAIGNGSTTGTLLITNTTLANNYAVVGGGAVEARSGSTETIIENSTFTDNEAGARGGAIYSNGGTTSVINSTFDANETAGSGGAIIANNGDYLRVINSTFYANDAAFVGGAIRNNVNSTTNIVNSTFTANNADSGGGGVSTSPSGTLTLTNSILLGNTSTGDDELDEGGGTVNFTGVNIIGTGMDTDASDGVINGDPTDVFQVVLISGAGGLAPNGGPVDTVAIRSGGAAENAGEFTAILPDLFDVDEDGEFVELFPQDARGSIRFNDGQIDIGAYELIEGGTPTAGNDTVGGDNADETINGLEGDDIIVGFGGNDTLIGSSGNDSILGGFGDDELFGFSDNDTLDGGEGNDTLSGSSGNDVLIGGRGDDTLFGSFGDDSILGGSGNDVIVGEGQNDTIDGGDGNDVANGGSGFDILRGRAGNDQLNGGANGDFVDGGAGVDTLFGGDGNDIVFGGSDDDFLSGGSGDDQVNGGDDGDVLNGLDGNDTLNGDAGNDTIFGFVGDDFITGGDDDDALSGNNGDDTVEGGAGNDFINGIFGADSLLGGAGMDTIFGGGQNDTIDGGAGDDLISGENGFDNINGGLGNDLLNGGASADVLFGGTDNDTVNGGDGNDLISGGLGNDVLNGNNNNDIIDGNGNFDTLNGGLGDDTLTGGLNADTFVFNNFFGNDVITDFDQANAFERIDLSAVTQITDFADLDANHLSEDMDGNAVITTGPNTITLIGVDMDDLVAGDFIF